MFWSAVVGGLTLLLKWRVWSVILILAAVEFGLRAAAGQLGVHLFWYWPSATIRLVRGLEWLISSVMVSAAIYALFPILIGVDRVMPLWIIVRDGVLILVAGLVTGFCVLVISALPLIGPLFKGGGVARYLQAVLVHSLYLENIIGGVGSLETPPDMYPSIGAAIGFLVIGVAAQFLTFAVAGRISNTADEESLPVPAQIVGMMCAYLPVFMYTEYVRLALHVGSSTAL